MRHAILGVGGVGGLIGAGLAHQGEDVALVVRRETLTSYPTELSLTSPFGNFSVPAHPVVAIDEPVDVLWIAVKASQLDSSLNVVDGSRVGTIVPLLNGVDHMALLRERFGPDKVIAAAIRVESERVAPGKIVHRTPFAQVTLGAAGRERLQSPIEKLRALGFKCEFVEDERTLLWSKLVMLAPTALTTTAAEMTRGEVARDPQWRQQFEACVNEACKVATASGAKVDPAAVIAFFDGLPEGMRSSMQKDVAAGDEPELDAIAGPILRGAEKFGLQVPVTQDLVARIVAKTRRAS